MNQPLKAKSSLLLHILPPSLLQVEGSCFQCGLPGPTTSCKNCPRAFHPNCLSIPSRLTCQYCTHASTSSSLPLCSCCHRASKIPCPEQIQGMFFKHASLCQECLNKRGISNPLNVGFVGNDGDGQLMFLVVPRGMAGIHRAWINQQQLEQIKQARKGKNTFSDLQIPKDCMTIQHIICAKIPLSMQNLSSQQILEQLINRAMGINAHVLGQRTNAWYLIKWSNKQTYSYTWEDQTIITSYLTAFVKFVGEVKREIYGQWNLSFQVDKMCQMVESKLNSLDKNEPVYQKKLLQTMLAQLAKLRKNKLLFGMPIPFVKITPKIQKINNFSINFVLTQQHQLASLNIIENLLQTVPHPIALIAPNFPNSPYSSTSPLPTLLPTHFPPLRLSPLPPSMPPLQLYYPCTLELRVQVVVGYGVLGVQREGQGVVFLFVGRDAVAKGRKGIRVGDQVVVVCNKEDLEDVREMLAQQQEEEQVLPKGKDRRQICHEVRRKNKDVQLVDLLSDNEEVQIKNTSGNSQMMESELIDHQMIDQNQPVEQQIQNNPQQEQEQREIQKQPQQQECRMEEDSIQNEIMNEIQVPQNQSKDNNLPQNNSQHLEQRTSQLEQEQSQNQNNPIHKSSVEAQVLLNESEQNAESSNPHQILPTIPFINPSLSLSPSLPHPIPLPPLCPKSPSGSPLPLLPRLLFHSFILSHGLHPFLQCPSESIRALLQEYWPGVEKFVGGYSHQVYFQHLQMYITYLKEGIKEGKDKGRQNKEFDGFFFGVDLKRLYKWICIKARNPSKKITNIGDEIHFYNYDKSDRSINSVRSHDIDSIRSSQLSGDMVPN